MSIVIAILLLISWAAFPQRKKNVMGVKLVQDALIISIEGRRTDVDSN